MSLENRQKAYFTAATSLSVNCQEQECFTFEFLIHITVKKVHMNWTDNFRYIYLPEILTENNILN